MVNGGIHIYHMYVYEAQYWVGVCMVGKDMEEDGKESSVGCCETRGNSSGSSDTSTGGASEEECIRLIVQSWKDLFQYWILSSTRNKTVEWIMVMGSEVYAAARMNDVASILRMHDGNVMARIARPKRRPTLAEPNLDPGYADIIHTRIQGALNTLRAHCANNNNNNNNNATTAHDMNPLEVKEEC